MFYILTVLNNSDIILYYDSTEPVPQKHASVLGISLSTAIVIDVNNLWVFHTHTLLRFRRYGVEMSLFLWILLTALVVLVITYRFWRGFSRHHSGVVLWQNATARRPWWTPIGQFLLDLLQLVVFLALLPVWLIKQIFNGFRRLRRNSSTGNIPSNLQYRQITSPTTTPQANFRASWIWITGITVATIAVIAIPAVYRQKNEPQVSAKSATAQAESASNSSDRIALSTEDLAETITEAAFRLERRSETRYTWNEYEPDYLHAGNSGPQSGQEAWTVNITSKVPMSLRGTDNDETAQKRRVSYVVALMLKNGNTVRQICDLWPTEIKGWTAGPRVDDIDGWKSSADYSRALELEFLNSAKGKTYGLDVKVKSLIKPSYIEQKPFDNNWFWTWLGLSLAGLTVAWAILFATKWKKSREAANYLALLPAIASGALFGWLCISRVITASWSYRESTVIALTIGSCLPIWMAMSALLNKIPPKPTK